MEIIGRNTEIDQFSNLLADWHVDRPLWVHFLGDPGVGKSHLIQYLLRNNLAHFEQLYYFNYRLCSLSIQTQIREMLQVLFRNFSKDIELFLSQYPAYLRNSLLGFLKNESGDFRNFPLNFLSELLLQLIQFLSNGRKTVFILENVNFDNDNHTNALFRLLNSNYELPVLILTSGAENPPKGFNINLIQLKGMTAVESHRFVQSHLSISAENARFIANHLQIKSQGNPRIIQFLLEAYFRDIIPENSQELLDPKKLQKLRISPIPQTIFKDLNSQLSGVERSVFTFLGRLIDPLPLEVLHKALKKLKADKGLIQTWLKKGYLSTEEFAGEQFAFIEWDEWKNFLKNNSSVEETKEILEVLKDNLTMKSHKFPLQLSNIYFDFGDFDRALKLAHTEARELEDMCFKERAYERYNFLKRNFHHYPDGTKSKRTILREMGLLQKSMGLNDNAFESFRELRDIVGKDNREEWFYATLQMAEVLLKMDAIAEARYLLNDLKIKKVADSATKSYSFMLLGDLEKNLTNQEYALSRYQKALHLINDNNDAGFIYRLYSRIRAIYLQHEQWDGLKMLIDTVLISLKENSKFKFMVKLDLLKLHMEKKDFESALNLGIQTYREIKYRFDPGIMAQLILYLVDVYAFLSKWYLAKSHLRQMMRIRFFITKPETAARIHINLAVVEKEVAHYGNALRLLTKAEGICKRKNLLHELNEIKIHKGHIQLLIHGYLRQREYLSGALQWSIVNQDHEVFIMASLYMSSYEIQQKRFDDAKNHLKEARTQITLTGSEIDKLNYMFYLIRYLLITEKYRWAERVLQVWETKSTGITKFENLVPWFKAKLYGEQGDHTKALAEYKRSLQRSQKYKLPHLEFHVLKEMVVLCHQSKMEKELGICIPQLKAAYGNLLEAINDEILRKQFCESREVHELMEIGIPLD